MAVIEVVAKVHRCDTCGAWSHAKKRPREHNRFIREDGLLEPDLPIIERYDEEVNIQGDPISLAGWTVRCGPFTTFDVVPEGTA